ncbi:MAG: 16S rRNA (guanine(527)-N(7))-methyltransferase RsmG [Frankia sp.]|nr:16S rRNA (guanine(527)-N(7))-methyltransferase RsmG [Frankia sp.]
MAIRYGELLATTGVAHGVVGPREAVRVWERHLLNCAVVAELVPAEAALADIGSGAGLPGIPLAIARPDLRVVLVEPLLRRSAFLTLAVDELGLQNASVRRERAEDLPRRSFDAATARAVAPLGRLCELALPTVRPGGLLLAIKGAAAPDELADAQVTLRTLGAAEATVVLAGVGVVEPPTRVVMVRAGLRGRAR